MFYLESLLKRDCNLWGEQAEHILSINIENVIYYWYKT